MTGKIGEQDADLIVTVTRTPLRIPLGSAGFAWAATVEVVGGGLIRVDERQYYNMAPESGYEPRFEHVQDAWNESAAQEGKSNTPWKENVSDTFFVSSRDGRNFARVNLRIRPNSDHKEGDNEALVAAEVWLNPNGSRNLEFDPAKVIPIPR